VPGGAFDALTCPVCGDGMRLTSRTLLCESGHTFDVAREGYVNLLGGGAHASTADTPAMVAARREFLAAGYFRPISEAVTTAARAATEPDAPGIVLDAGGGTGEYLSAILDALPERTGLVVDVSKHAARFAARAHPRGSAIVSDVWGQLPVHDSSVALITCIFAPRNAEEFARVLAPGGALIVVTPTGHHLRELVEPLGLLEVDPDKQDRLAEKLGPFFATRAREVLEYRFSLTRAHAVTAALMGPSAAHVSAADLTERAKRLADPVTVSTSVNVATFVARR